jgi:hypothetical protein
VLVLSPPGDSPAVQGGEVMWGGCCIPPILECGKERRATRGEGSLVGSTHPFHWMRTFSLSGLLRGFLVAEQNTHTRSGWAEGVEHVMDTIPIWSVARRCVVRPRVGVLCSNVCAGLYLVMP